MELSNTQTAEGTHETERWMDGCPVTGVNEELDSKEWLFDYGSHGTPVFTKSELVEGDI